MTDAAIPTTLEEAFEALDAMLREEDRKYLQEAEDPDKAAISLHHSLGRHLRNTWGLWGDSPLKKHIRERFGFIHPDDMSGFILRQYCRARYPTAWDRLLREDIY
jgi:hypothetical protein